MKKFIIKLLLKSLGYKHKEYKIIIMAHSTGTPSLDCTLNDLFRIINFEGKNDFTFKGEGADLIIREVENEK